MGQVSPVPGQGGRPKKFPYILKQSITLAVSNNLRLSVRVAAALSVIAVSRESIRAVAMNWVTISMDLNHGG
jgi:hypothetical protein